MSEIIESFWVGPDKYTIIITNWGEYQVRKDGRIVKCCMSDSSEAYDYIHKLIAKMEQDDE